MKRILCQTLLIFALFLPILPIAHAADNYTLDPNHTYVMWNINHFGFSNPSGKWMASGTLKLDQANPQNSQVNVTIKVGDIVTGISDLDAHLKSSLFFDVSKYPLASFMSNKVDITGKDTAKVTGILTVHGVAKPVVLDVSLNKIGVSPITDKQTVGFTATTTLKRSDFGINTLLPGLGDDVKIYIQVEAYK